MVVEAVLDSEVTLVLTLVALTLEVTVLTVRDEETLVVIVVRVKDVVKDVIVADVSVAVELVLDRVAVTDPVALNVDTEEAVVV